MSELSSAARPYAKAVFEMARESGDLQGWSDVLTSLTAVVADPQMQAVIEAPNRTRDDKAQAVISVCGDALPASASNLLKLMASNDRLSAMADVAAQFEQLKADAEGTVEARVRTAMPLDDQQQSRIAEALGKRLNRTVNIVCEIDESLLGGAIIQANDLVIDGSIKGKLDKLGQTLTR